VSLQQQMGRLAGIGESNSSHAHDDGNNPSAEDGKRCCPRSRVTPVPGPAGDRRPGSPAVEALKQRIHQRKEHAAQLQASIQNETKAMRCVLKESVLGQNMAAGIVATTIQTRVGLDPLPPRPCVMFFAGAAGCGRKTFIKALVAHLFPGVSPEKAVLELDCARYKTADSRQLLGSNDSELMEFLKQVDTRQHAEKPVAGLLVLRRLAAAHPTVLNAIIHFMDTGEFNNQVLGRHLVVVADGHAGCDVLPPLSEIKEAWSEEEVRRVLELQVAKAVCRGSPTLLSRIGVVVPFLPLSHADREVLVKKLLDDEAVSADVDFDPAVLTKMIELSTNPMTGLRPVVQAARAIRRFLIDEKRKCGARVRSAQDPLRQKGSSHSLMQAVEGASADGKLSRSNSSARLTAASEKLNHAKGPSLQRLERKSSKLQVLASHMSPDARKPTSSNPGTPSSATARKTSGFRRGVPGSPNAAPSPSPSVKFKPITDEDGSEPATPVSAASRRAGSKPKVAEIGPKSGPVHWSEVASTVLALLHPDTLPTPRNESAEAEFTREEQAYSPEPSSLFYPKLGSPLTNFDEGPRRLPSRFREEHHYTPGPGQYLGGIEDTRWAELSAKYSDEVAAAIAALPPGGYSTPPKALPKPRPKTADQQLEARLDGEVLDCLSGQMNIFQMSQRQAVFKSKTGRLQNQSSGTSGKGVNLSPATYSIHRGVAHTKPAPHVTSLATYGPRFLPPGALFSGLPPPLELGPGQYNPKLIDPRKEKRIGFAKARRTGAWKPSVTPDPPPLEVGPGSFTPELPKKTSHTTAKVFGIGPKRFEFTDKAYVGIKRFK